jgi:hypothetical protein
MLLPCYPKRMALSPIVRRIAIISKAKLGAYITHLAPEKLRELRDAVGFALGFDVMN